MFFFQWQNRAEELTGLRGHGSRKRIAAKLGLTSETIKNAEKSGKSSPKMMKSLTELEAQLHKDRFERLRGEAGRWNIGDSIGGALVTHVQPPFAFTAQFLWPNPEQDEDWRTMRVRVVAYDLMSEGQLADLIEEAREVAARRMRLIE